LVDQQGAGLRTAADCSRAQERIEGEALPDPLAQRARRRTFPLPAMVRGEQ
jgi:hypothetical protein